MNSEQYLDQMLAILSGSFDIQRPAIIDGRTYPAYGRYAALSEKYLVTRKVNLWSVKTYEHLLFMTVDKCTEETLKEARGLIEGRMENVCVRNGEKYPEEDHMISYITVCILSNQSPRQDILSAVRKYRFVKNYLFTVRGRSLGRLICVDLDTATITASRSASQVLHIYHKGFNAKKP